MTPTRCYDRDATRCYDDVTTQHTKTTTTINMTCHDDDNVCCHDNTSKSISPKDSTTSMEAEELVRSNRHKTTGLHLTVKNNHHSWTNPDLPCRPAHRTLTHLSMLTWPPYEYQHYPPTEATAKQIGQVMTSSQRGGRVFDVLLWKFFSLSLSLSPPAGQTENKQSADHKLTYLSSARCPDVEGHLLDWTAALCRLTDFKWLNTK